MSDSKRVVIVPCSGIGKTYGSVSREAAYDVTQDLRPDTSELVPLSLLVLGDEAARTGRFIALKRVNQSFPNEPYNALRVVGVVSRRFSSIINVSISEVEMSPVESPD